ncbi:MAG TPA: hypothetical protein VH309_04830 [Elusimicrobiota bacterium]|jgi:hypothetical protein|nr:hypothetical protein [Elusimicrobiota bacterium]
MEAAISGPAPMNWKQRLTHRTTLMAVAGGVALGAAAAGAWWRVWVVPAQALNEKRYESTLDIAKLYGLQLSYKRAHGTYADDFPSLLTVDPDGAALKANLAKNVDMNTLTVVGDKDKFRVELNVLDPDRTPIKLRGPIKPRPRSAGPSTLPAPAPPMNADGSPIAPAR